MKSMIEMIIARDCHVGESYMKVIRHVTSRLVKGRITFWAMSKSKRRKLMKTCIAAHKDNQELYSYVMDGGMR